jgi:3-mercaptopyruvate sulfurtransferase SseA
VQRIAKELGSKGYGKVFVVEGGFQGWSAAQLKTKASFSAKADAVMFSRPKLPSIPAPRRSLNLPRMFPEYSLGTSC